MNDPRASVNNAVVESLAQKYEFHSACPLVEKFEEISRRYEKHQKMFRPSWAQRRTAAEKINKHVSALLDALPELDRVGGGLMVRPELRKALVELQGKTAQSVSKLTGMRGGGPKRDDAGHILVMDLYQLYCCWTNKKDRYTAHEWSPDGPTHSGTFINFAMEATVILNVELKPSFIAQTIKEANLDQNSPS